MMLKFETPQVRQLAEQLMQPALIRVIDNIRKQLDVSDWQGCYQETQLWPEDMQESQLQRIKTLQAQLSYATPEEADALRDELASLPQPFPGYELHLTRGEQETIVNVWELCYCVCFEAFPVPDGAVKVDTSLIDRELNDVDWLVLDNKAKAIVEDVFGQLGT
ncbi:MAG: hypothetical protein F6K42_05355 [Leptolyngbya sp. SIO1D8]|nr:hypothetical protein [Leptolyngbya sp. SIO1D8]